MRVQRRAYSFIVRAAAFIFLASGCHGWTARDTALELAAQASLAADAYSTHECVQTPKQCWEDNPLIGRRAERLPEYFIGAGVIHAAIAAVLPHGWWRTSWQALTIGVEAVQVYRNVGEIEIAHTTGPAAR